MILALFRTGIPIISWPLMFVGSKTMLSKIWGLWLFFSGEGGIDCVSSFKYLSTTLDQKWNWKLPISSPSRKLSHQLAVFNRILHMLEKRSHLAYFNGLVLPQLDYENTIWGDQPRLTSEMQQLQAFQNQFAKKIAGGKFSSAKAVGLVHRWGCP